MGPIPLLPLNDGRSLPRLGFGVFEIPANATRAAVATAIDAGYRLVDTASIYGNERGVGDAVRSAPVPRSEIFVTTKVWNDRHGYDPALRACAESLERLGLDYVDLYLIHWPAPRRNAFVDTWKALIRLRDEGKARSIGVSNFTIPALCRLIDETGIVPAINQIELHPGLQQRALSEFHARRGIVTECWSPLAQGDIPGGPIARLAEKYGKTRAQITLRWHIDCGFLPIPKSVTPSRIRENREILDFKLAPEELAEIASLDRGARIGPDPDEFP